MYESIMIKSQVESEIECIVNECNLEAELLKQQIAILEAKLAKLNCRMSKLKMARTIIGPLEIGIDDQGLARSMGNKKWDD